MSKTKQKTADYSIRNKRVKFLFDDGEFRHQVISKQKRKMVEHMREEEAWDEFETDACTHGGS